MGYGISSTVGFYQLSPLLVLTVEVRGGIDTLGWNGTLKQSVET